MDSETSPGLYLEVLAPTTHQSLPAQAAWRQTRRGAYTWMFAKGTMAFIQNAGCSNRDVKPVARRSGFIQSVRKMEQACFKEMNRLVRTRMLGGVGGARRKPAPIPIVLLFAVLNYDFTRPQEIRSES